MQAHRVESQCEHEFFHKGVEYKIAGQRWGSGAHNREYFDVYRCKKCLEKKAVRIGLHGHTYEKPDFGATPWTRE